PWSSCHLTPYSRHPVQVVLPTPHRRSQPRRTPVTLGALARSAWGRPASRDLLFAPLPFARVFVAWLGIAIAIRMTDGVREGILAPLFGGVAGEIIGTMLSIGCVLAVTKPFFRTYTGQYAGALIWYGFVLA